MKLELFTAGKDSLIMRIENLEDTFTNNNVTYQTINLKQLTESLYTLVNGLDTSETIHVEEVTLTANQPYDTMQANRAHWKTVDDSTNTVGFKGYKAGEWEKVELQSQRIRVFQVFYNMPEQVEFLQ